MSLLLHTPRPLPPRQAKYEKSLKRKERREEGAASTADLATEEDAQAQEEMAAAGFEFAGFGGSKKNN